LLADNLYPDPRKRAGYYQYKLKDGSSKVFAAATIEDANLAAEEANAMRDQLPEIVAGAALRRDQLAFHVTPYIEYMEKINPKLKMLKRNGKSQWKNDQYALHQLAREIEFLQQITYESLRTWWDGLTYYQQHGRLASMRRFFSWLMGQGLLPKLKFNPFALSYDQPRLLVKMKIDKVRPPLTQIGYRKVHQAAGELGYECLQIAMGISLYTTLREGDVVHLKFKEHIVENVLRVVIGKSEQQRGSAKAARLSWDLEKHPTLKKLINRARELALINKGSPFVISHTPMRRVWNERKEHICQVTEERVARMFADARTKAGVPGVVFHEVRGLSSTLYKIAGYTEVEIQNLMAHESVDTTLGYMDADSLPYEEVTMRLDVER